MKSALIFFDLCVCFCIIVMIWLHFSSSSMGISFTKHPNYPPPGYKIVCDKERGWYAPQMLNTMYIIERDYLGEPFKSYQTAVDRAWDQYNFVSPPKEKCNWGECE